MLAEATQLYFVLNAILWIRESKQYSLNEDDGERDHTLQQSSFLLHFHWYENRKQQSMNQLSTTDELSYNQYL